jgi:hypothetical protein
MRCSLPTVDSHCHSALPCCRRYTVRGIVRSRGSNQCLNSLSSQSHQGRLLRPDFRPCRACRRRPSRPAFRHCSKGSCSLLRTRIGLTVTHHGMAYYLLIVLCCGTGPIGAALHCTALPCTARLQCETVNYSTTDAVALSATLKPKRARRRNKGKCVLWLTTRRGSANTKRQQK